MHEIQQTTTPANQITYVYKTIDDINTQIKFFGLDNENLIRFLKQCQRSMENINDNLGDVDKINWVVRHLKGTAAEWFSIIQDKVLVYEDLVDHFKARYCNEEILRKVRVQLDSISMYRIKVPRKNI